MARRPYVHLAGNISGWPKGFVPTPKHLRNLDQYASELVNGDEGGTWAPEEPIIVGPYADTTSPTIVINTGSSVTGSIETVKGNSLGAELHQTGIIVTSGGPIVFQSSRTRSVVVPFTFYTEADTPQNDVGPLFAVDPITFGARRTDVKGTSGSAGIPGDAVINVALPFRAQHRGATISQVDFRFRVTPQRSELPTAYVPGPPNNGRMPKFRIVRVAAASLTATSLHTAVGAYDASGWYVDQAATASDYYNNGQTRTISYVPNQNNTSIDPGTHFFLLQIADEWTDPAKTWNNIYLSATVSLTSMPNFQE